MREEPSLLRDGLGIFSAPPTPQLLAHRLQRLSRASPFGASFHAWPPATEPSSAPSAVACRPRTRMSRTPGAPTPTARGAAHVLPGVRGAGVRRVERKSLGSRASLLPRGRMHFCNLGRERVRPQSLRLVTDPTP